MRKLMLAAAVIAAFASRARAQEFEAVSIKPNPSMSKSSHSRTDGGMLNGSNLSLRSLILTAYDLKDYQLEGPDWLDSVRFDITAKFSQPLPKDRDQALAMYSAMMRHMLEDRFKLTAHRDRKMFTVYGLTAAKRGIKFKAVPDGPSTSDSDGAHYEGVAISMARFAEFLSRHEDLPVLDMTGLKGSYNLTLDWAAELKEAGDSGAGLAVRDAVEQQLGLQLETRKAPLEIVVVDHAEKVPTEN